MTIFNTLGRPRCIVHCHLGRVFLFTILEWEWPECKIRAFFYSAFLFRNGQNAIPSILLPGAEWTECCEWKSKMADGEMSAADSNTSLPEKKSGYTFGHNETLLLISLYQKYEVVFSDVSYKKKAGPGPCISTGVFFMQTIRIIPSIPYQPFLFQNCG